LAKAKVDDAKRETQGLCEDIEDLEVAESPERLEKFVMKFAT
jgi:hypothetical protein